MSLFPLYLIKGHATSFEVAEVPLHLISGVHHARKGVYGSLCNCKGTSQLVMGLGAQTAKVWTTKLSQETLSNLTVL